MFKKSALLLSLATSLMVTGCGVMPTGLFGGAGGDLSAQGTKGPKAGASDWTVFVYIAGDNNLSPFAAKDLNEMEAGLSSERVKVVALVDQDRDGDSRILEIKHDPKGVNNTLVSPVIDDGGAVIPKNTKEVDTGSSATLEKFINWGTKNYPSKRSMLIMWNHGGGAFAMPNHLKSFCWDDQSGNNLNLVDLWRATQKVSSKAKFDVIGFDTCLLGHAETAYQLRDVADFLVSSEKVEPGDGWDYEALTSTLSKTPGMYPREFSTKIVETYTAWYKKARQESTLSSIDLQKLKDRVVPGINELAVNLQAGLATPAFKSALAGVVNKAASLSATGEGEEDAIDLGLFCNLIQASSLPATTKTLAKDVNTHLTRSVVSNMTNRLPDGAFTGLKIYFGLETYNTAYSNGSHQIFGTTPWAKFLQSYLKK
ncbi:Clostripain precursor [compost metagenome]